MKYLGGKSRIAKTIAEIIDVNNQGADTIISLFCGSCAIEAKLNSFATLVCNDKHEYLIEMFRALQNGWIPPDNVSAEEYYYIKANKDEDKALSGFVGFGCSFCGRWFEGYARDHKTDRNFAKEAKTSLQRDMDSGLRVAKFTNEDYRDVILPDGCVVFADPPYQNTKGYSGIPVFDTETFWQYSRETSKKHLTYICEQTAPEDFICIWEKPVTRTVNSNKRRLFKATEKLFVHKCNIDKVNFKD